MNESNVAADSQVFSVELASRWPEFVDCSRRAKTMNPFIRSLLSPPNECQIIDLCAGAGCEVVEMARRGWHVTGNEINAGLRSRAAREAGYLGSRITWTDVDWRELTHHFPPRSFDLILLLGNSFCLVHDAIERMEIAEQIAAICARHGRVVIDERNFRYILSQAESILQGRFRYSKQVIYCGDSIQGRPVKIGPSNVRFGYFDALDKHLLGTMDMWPFRMHEIEQVFHSVGFRTVRRLGDLGLRDMDQADFITYVFERT